jgi:hypothetical protein
MLVEQTMGFNLKKGFKKAIHYTPHAIAYRAVKKGVKATKKRFFGDSPTWNDVLMGTEILGKAKKGKGFITALKNIGKFTSPITTGLAKTFLPASIVNAAAKLDPTKKGVVTPKAVQQAVAIVQNDPLVNVPSTDTGIKANALLDTLKNPKVLAIIGGGAVLLFILKKRG